MNKLKKMSSAERAVSNPGGDSNSLLDDMAQHSCASLGIARETEEPTAGSKDTLPGLQASAKPQSLRVAVKIMGKILFMNLGDVVSVQAKGGAFISKGRQVPIYCVSLSRMWRRNSKPMDSSASTDLCS